MLDTEHKRASRWRDAVATALVGMVALSLASTAEAGDWKKHHWKKHHRHHHHGWVGPVFVPPGHVRYAPAPVFYGPPPVVMYPQPYTYVPSYPVYGPPGGSLDIGVSVPLR